MDDTNSDSASLSSKQSVESSCDDLSDGSSENLADLQLESEMPIDELMRRFQQSGETSTVVVNDVVACNLTPDADEVDKEDEDTDSSVGYNKPSLFSHFMKTEEKGEDDEERDIDYDPVFDLDDFYKIREPRIGEEYQISEDFFVINGQLEDDVERIGSLVWNPYLLTENAVKKYLLHFYGIYTKQSVAGEISSRGTSLSNVDFGNRDNEVLMHNIIADHEHALFQLLLSDFDVDEAIRFWNINPPIYISVTPYLTPASLSTNPLFDVWSEDEVRLFEWALRLYGKQFHIIHDKTLPGRTVSELVEFYYHWKLTDRYHYLRANKQSNRYAELPEKQHGVANAQVVPGGETCVK